MNNNAIIPDINYIIQRSVLNYTEWIGTVRYVFVSPQVLYSLLWNCQNKDFWFFMSSPNTDHDGTMFGGSVRVVEVDRLNGFRLSQNIKYYKLLEQYEPILNYNFDDAEKVCSRLCSIDNRKSTRVYVNQWVINNG